MSTILLKGGTVLIHGDDDKISPVHTDILIETDRITNIGHGIEVPKDCEVIDCNGKLVSPGFIETHHHVWQAAMKGLFSD